MLIHNLPDKKYKIAIILDYVAIYNWVCSTNYVCTTLYCSL